MSAHWHPCIHPRETCARDRLSSVFADVRRKFQVRFAHNAETAVSASNYLSWREQGALRVMAEPGSSLTKCLAVQLRWPVDADLVHASHMVHPAQVQLQQLLTLCAVLVKPTTPQRAFAFAAAVPVNQANLADYANFAGNPPLSVPIPVAEAELPRSLQLISRSSGELRLIALAGAFQHATRGSPRVPSACYSWWSR